VTPRPRRWPWGRKDSPGSRYQDWATPASSGSGSELAEPVEERLTKYRREALSLLKRNLWQDDSHGLQMTVTALADQRRDIREMCAATGADLDLLEDRFRDVERELLEAIPS
jgi:hypothetical protein